VKTMVFVKTVARKHLHVAEPADTKNSSTSE